MILVFIWISSRNYICLLFELNPRLLTILQTNPIKMNMIILTLLTRLTLSFDLLFIPLLSFPNSRHSYKTQSFTSMSIIDSRTSHMRFLISINNILTRISISHLKSTQILITMINRSNQINYISSGLPILTHQYILT